MRIPPGLEAPRRARDAVIARLGAQLGREVAHDVRVVVSELVADCVRRRPDREVELEAGVVGDRVLITVSHPGDPPTGLSLLVVERLVRSWGVACDGAGRSRVWCELALS